jgi:hypothetical protein
MGYNVGVELVQKYVNVFFGMVVAAEVVSYE